MLTLPAVRAPAEKLCEYLRLTGTVLRAVRCPGRGTMRISEVDGKNSLSCVYSPGWEGSQDHCGVSVGKVGAAV